MVKTVSATLPLSNGQIDVESWLTQLHALYPPAGIELIRHACIIGRLDSPSETSSATDSFETHPAFEIATRLLKMQVDYETIAAALVYQAVQQAELSIEDLQDNLGLRVAKLVTGVIQMDAIDIFQNQISNQRQIETVREMLLTMVDDVRVVLIKLAEHCCLMHAMEFRGNKEQRLTAEATQLIYAPLASRLGVNDIKWELEDLAFRYLETETYRTLARLLNEKRLVREQYVNDFITNLSSLLQQENITYHIYGRAKHIYSIYKKMQHKQLEYNEIYDANAVRVLVDNIEDCYKVLSIIHNAWKHIPDEFDDYIATPKANGYASIHTVAIGPHNKPIEIQIRTHEMHEKNEIGGAAHWLYKEGTTQSAYDRKIVWLRELLAWQKELADASELPEHLKQNLIADRIYAFTPNGDLISLPLHATPLDFAYHIHSDVGHCCRGAKVNNKIVPLTYKLQTGDKVEILTGKVLQPSRDWLNPHAGYLASLRARAKVHTWFKRQEQENVHAQGRDLIEREFKKLNLRNIDLSKIAKRLHIKSIDNLMIAVGNGDVQIDQLLKAVDLELNIQSTKYQQIVPIRHTKLDTQKSNGISVEGVEDLLTHIAGCCKPLPGDKILGYVTQGHGITIHNADCENIHRQAEENEQRVFEVSWGKKINHAYPVTIQIDALDRQDLIYDITLVFSQAKIHLLDFNTKIDAKKHMCRILAKLAIPNIETLNHALTQINQLANIYEVIRIK